MRKNKPHYAIMVSHKLGDAYVSDNDGVRLFSLASAKSQVANWNEQYLTQPARVVHVRFITPHFEELA